MSAMTDHVAAALEQAFKDRVAASAGQPFKATGVISPGPEVWQAYACAGIAAMRDLPPSLQRFNTPDGNLIDWSYSCAYCGGHKFAWQATIDEALK